jgi:hypothetical protein
MFLLYKLNARFDTPFSDINEVVLAIEKQKSHGRLRHLAEASSDSGDIIQLQSRIKSIFENLQVFAFRFLSRHYFA